MKCSTQCAYFLLIGFLASVAPIVLPGVTHGALINPIVFSDTPFKFSARIETDVRSTRATVGDDLIGFGSFTFSAGTTGTTNWLVSIKQDDYDIFFDDNQDDIRVQAQHLVVPPGTPHAGETAPNPGTLGDDLEAFIHDIEVDRDQGSATSPADTDTDDHDGHDDTLKIWFDSSLGGGFDRIHILITHPTAGVPEPSSLALLCLGMLLVTRHRA